MKPNFNQHTYELRKKVMSYTDSMRHDETLSDLAERKPSQYRVSILGFGLQGEKITEYLALQRDNELASNIRAVQAFKRRVRPLMEDEKGKVAEPEFITRMHQMQKGAVSGPIEPKINEFYFIQELYSRFGLGDYLMQAGTPNPMSDILVVCPRYGFDDMDISEKGLEKAVKAGDEDMQGKIHRTRANLASTFPHLDSYRGSVPSLVSEMSKTLADILKEKNRINSILNTGMDQGMLVKRDSASISDHIIGAKTLGNWLRNVDYQGFVLAVSNPLDIITYTLMSHSGLPPSRVIGIEDHDQARFTYEFAKKLSESEFIKAGGEKKPRYSFDEVNIPMFGQHNFNQRPNLEQARFSGIDNLTGKQFKNIGIRHFEAKNYVMETLEFIARDYISYFLKHAKEFRQGSSIETGDATVNTIYSIIMSSDLPVFRRRVAGYSVHDGEPIVDGIQARLSYRGAYQAMTSRNPTEEEKQGLVRGAEQMGWLVNALGEAGIIDKLTKEERMRREQAYSKRWQNMDWTPPYVEKVSSPILEKEKQSGLNIGKLNVGTVGRDLFIADTIYTDNKK